MYNFKIKRFDKTSFERDFFISVGDIATGFNIQVVGKAHIKELKQNPHKKFFKVIIQSIYDFTILEDENKMGLDKLLLEVQNDVFSSIGASIWENTDVYYYKNYTNEPSVARLIFDEDRNNIVFIKKIDEKELGI